MNFLSHYYFEMQNENSFEVLGTVLPDLVKNAHKDWNFYPQKRENEFDGTEALNSILKGWKRHIHADVLFHSSAFFTEHTAQLKVELLPILAESKVRPSFLAHIALELLLDHLLVVNGKVNIDSFYDHLASINPEGLKNFLKKCGCTDTEHFFRFYNGFISSRYLLSYQKIENISYALQRICMRIWVHPFHEQTINEITEKLICYLPKLKENYLDIFNEIEGRIK